MLTEFSLILTLLQQMCVYLVIAYLLSKTPLFIPLTQVTIRLPHKLVCYLVFSVFCVMGTYFGLHIDDSIANTRATGAVLGGMLGGPWVGLAVGFTGGLHRYSLGGVTAGACMASTMAEGLLGGLVHRYFVRRGQVGRVFDPLAVAAVALLAECLQMLILLAAVKPFAAAWHLVRSIALPMMIANTLGAAMFMRILLDRRALAEKYSSAFSSKALQIAARAEGVLRHGFDRDNCMTMARILYEELGVGAVALTDRERLLAFIGAGADHHLAGTPITSPLTQRAIAANQVVYADGNETPYRCSISPACKLGSSLVIPLRGEDERVIGTIKLYETRNKLFSGINLTLGEGIARLLSNQILQGKYEQQKQLLAQTEIKLLHAQVNPHFLFNALNTLSAVIRRNPEHARQLVQYLSTFFRKNLKRSSEMATLGDEIDHVSAYLRIEEARFAGRLQVEIEAPEAARRAELPAFSLQPLVENAIKHGTSQLLEPGRIRIAARCDAQGLRVTVEDNAGLYRKPEHSDGLGMSLVDRRIRARYGEAYGVAVDCAPELYTRVSLLLPCRCPRADAQRAGAAA
ncbi:two-component system LytT family sensor kinase [Chromobacterium alkanivorans]|uniref:sensor histidine kinase n=1 Tax=Chromobacterium alkanivorans TaxID=1071719 RepID=UPI0023EEE0AF|nr:sensor histidine kinase [Chromobacterium alkanivorans]MCS3804319.1 two-component system LytT family sensor kinase [Chromobacterium alkanivorans]MCS3818461.1 two-component system LytT family sensor kinase [Chromobacterium alkanivorans]MCS3873604.1 two-component system LytT family sensor kinase [Chromobacterium alkanivorans]